MPPKIIEHYENWSPPPTVRPDVGVLLRWVDERYVAGIDAVVLTNGEQGSRRRRLSSMSRRVPGQKAAGMYHYAWRGKPAYIELFVDRIGANDRSWTKRIPLLRRVGLAQVLFHEIGHHVHTTKHREFADKEVKAEEWCARLTTSWIRKQYPVLARVVWIVGRIAMRVGWRYRKPSSRPRAAAGEVGIPARRRSGA